MTTPDARFRPAPPPGPPPVVAAASAAARSLPAHDVLVAGEPAPVTGDLLVPGHGAVAVVAQVTGEAAGVVGLVVSAELAELLREPPFGSEDLGDALEPALADALAALEPAAGPLAPGATRAVDVQALSFGAGAVAVPLHDGPRQVATFVLQLEPEPRATAPEFTPLVEGPASPRGNGSLELLHEVEMAVAVELGRTRMTVRDLLALGPGSVVELDRAAGSPVDVLVNGKLIARGEVVVIDEDFGIRISEIVGRERRR